MVSRFARPTSAAAPLPTDPGTRRLAASCPECRGPGRHPRPRSVAARLRTSERRPLNRHARHIASICRADILLTVLELAILGLLKEHPMHGYDLRKRLRGDFGLLSSLSFGSLYPALARLEAAGAVQEVRTGHGATGSAVP